MPTIRRKQQRRAAKGALALTALAKLRRPLVALGVLGGGAAVATKLRTRASRQPAMPAPSTPVSANGAVRPVEPAPPSAAF